MLQALLGTRSAERVLLFLLVNETGYSHQLSQALDLSLSSIQNTLQRLERGEVLLSNFEGKRLVYALNRKNPMIDEVERLLQKAFNQLTIAERKMYYTSRVSTRKSERVGLRHLWDELSKVSRVKLVATSSTWNGVGEGEVQVIKGESTLEFIESGQWQGAQSYRNHFRFSYLRDQGMIALEHLRFGKMRPQFLFHLTMVRPGFLESTDPHLCGEDTYLGKLEYTQLYIMLKFRTIGPKKNEKIESIYT